MISSKNLRSSLRLIQGFFQKNLHWLTLGFTLFAGTALLFLYLAFLVPSLVYLRKEAAAIRLEVARLSQYQAEHFLHENIGVLRDLAQITGAANSAEQKKIIIDRFLKERKDFQKISLVDRTGQEILKRSQFEIFAEKDFKNLSWSESFFLPKEGQTYLSPVYFSEKSEPFVTVGLPIWSDPVSISGVLSADFSLKPLWDVVAGVQPLGASTQVYLVDSRGYLIAHPSVGLVLRKTNLLRRAPVEKVVIDRKSLTDLSEEYVNEKGQAVAVIGLPLAGVGWGVFVEDTKENIDAPYRNLQSLGWIFVAAITVFFLVLFWGVWMLSRAWQDLKKSQAQLQSKTTELEEARASLEVRVQARTRELEDLTADLEKKVAERTAELQDKVSTLEKFQKLIVGRELKMIELKEKMKQMRRPPLDA